MALLSTLSDRSGWRGKLFPQRTVRVLARMLVALAPAQKNGFGTISKEGRDPEACVHKALAVMSGAMGGALGVSGGLVELPDSTMIMLRSIAWIAQSEGEDLADSESALACIRSSPCADTPARTTCTRPAASPYRPSWRSPSRALHQMAGRGVVDESASAIVRLLAQIGALFGVVVSQKVAAQAIPIIGAIGDAALNAAFVEHFQTLARGHFTVRRLERIYGSGTVRRVYEEILKGIGR